MPISIEHVWSILHRRGLLALAVVSLALTTGCAQLPLGNPTASFENIEKANVSRTAPVAVGLFKIDTQANAEIDKGLSVRSNTISSPFEGSFSQYLRQTLITDLQAAGLYDAAAQTTLSGFLTGSTLDVPIETGNASLSARFILVRTGKTIYEKELKASVTWPSSFIGVEAIPAGINQYSSLYHQLVGKLLDDPDYRSANPK